MTIIEQLIYTDLMVIRQFHFKLNYRVKSVFLKNVTTVR